MNFSKYQKYSILAVADFISIMLAGVISYYILAYYIDVTMSVTMGLAIIYYFAYLIVSFFTKNYQGGFYNELSHLK